MPLMGVVLAQSRQISYWRAAGGCPSTLSSGTQSRNGGGKQELAHVQHSLVATVHTLTDFSHCYITEAFSLLILYPGAICPAFHASLTPAWRLDLAWLPDCIPHLTSLGVVYFLRYKMKY